MTGRTKLWLATRRRWVQLNPPNHEGFYICAICGLPVHINDMEVDHRDGRKGERISNLNNLQPVHSVCNRLKGSQKWQPKVSLEEYELRRRMDL